MSRIGPKRLFQQVIHHARQRISLKTGKNIGCPTNIYVAVTHHCNFRCTMCHDWMTKKKELSIDECKLVLTKLFSWLPSGAKLNFSGGEPFVKKGFLETLATIPEREKMLVGITSNGYLVTDEKAKAMMEMELFNVNFSLDSPDRHVNDVMRGKEGAFDALEKAIERVLYWKKELRSETIIMLKTVICEKNMDQLSDLVAFTKDHGLNGIYFQPLEQTFGDEPDKHWFTKNELWPQDLNKVKKALQNLIHLKNSGSPVINTESHLQSMVEYFDNPLENNPRICPLGYTTFFLYPDGSVYFCPAFRSIGNLLESNPEDIWNGEEAKIAREEIKECRKICVLTCQFQQTLTDKARTYLSLIRKKS